MEVRSISRHWAGQSLWGRQLLNSLISLTKPSWFSSRITVILVVILVFPRVLATGFCVPHLLSSSVWIQLRDATTKCNGVSFIWENSRSVRVYVYPPEHCSPAWHVFSDFCWWQNDWGKDPLVRVWYQERFWLLTNPVVFWVLVLKPSFYRFSIGSVWCLHIV